MKIRDEEGWEMFLNLCVKAKTTARFQEMFDLLLTIEEKEHLASRMQIVKALLHGKQSQREISESMRVSISQITRGSNALKIVSRDFLTFIKAGLKNE